MDSFPGALSSQSVSLHIPHVPLPFVRRDPRIWRICQVSLQGELERNYTPRRSSLYNYTVVDTNFNRKYVQAAVGRYLRVHSSARAARGSAAFSAAATGEGGYTLVHQVGNLDFIVGPRSAYNEVTLNR